MNQTNEVLAEISRDMDGVPNPPQCAFCASLNVTPIFLVDAPEGGTMECQDEEDADHVDLYCGDCNTQGAS